MEAIKELLSSHSPELIFTPKSRIQCYSISDLHADSRTNWDWLRLSCKPFKEQVCDRDDCFTVILIPGDVATNIDRLDETFKILVSRFDCVCYVPGNHELWTQGSSRGAIKDPDSVFHFQQAANSVQKLAEVLDCALSNNVHIVPVQIVSQGACLSSCSLVVFPLYSWYHKEWDLEPKLTHPLHLEAERVCGFTKKWTDFQYCSWPAELVNGPLFDNEIQTSNACVKTTNTDAIAREFSALNEPIALPFSSVVTVPTTVISFSHFLPRNELLPEKRMLLEPSLPSVCGSNYLKEQVRLLRPDIHVYGHSHIPMDIVIDETRYIQWPLGTLREANLLATVQSNGPLLVYDSHLGNRESGIPDNLPSSNTHWSVYYKNFRRNPEVIDRLSPWLENRLKQLIG